MSLTRIPFGYDANKNLSSITNALNQKVLFQKYSSDGQVQKMVDPNGTVVDIVYYTNGNIKSLTSNGATTTIEWYSHDHVRKLTTPSGQSVSYTYQFVRDGNAQPIAPRVGFGGQYPRGRFAVDSIEDNLGNRIELQLDSKGNTTQYQIKDSLGKVTFSKTQTFDNLGRLFESLGENGQSGTFNYDANGNISSITNALNNVTTREFNSLNQLKKISNPLSGDTLFGYDQFENINKITDGEGKVTEFQYNAFTEVTQLTSADTGISKFTYDKAGNLLTKTDARGILTTFTYDALNRIKTQVYADATENITYTYDETAGGNKGIGKLTKVTDQSGTTSYQYNAFGLISQATQVIGGKTYIAQYQFDGNRQLTGVVYPNGRIITYSFNLLGQVTGLTSLYQSQTKTLASNMTYLPMGPMRSLTYGNGKVLTQVFDQDYRLTNKNTTGISTNVYGYDLMNNITSITDSLNTSTNQTFTYDKLSRLTNANGEYGSLAYAYDKIGNRLSKTDNSNVDNYEYGSTSHQLTKMTGSNPLTFSYDAIGNTLTKGDLTFSYNQQGRLKTASKVGMNANYTYNSNGQRVLKQVEGVTTHFIYNLNGQLIAEADANGVIQKEFIYLNGRRLATINGNTLYYVHTDHLGTPIALTNEAGIVQWKAHYTPFGKVIVDVDTITNNIRFPGQYFDQETGLHYNYFRDYDPEIGRYIQSDPIGLAGGINTYGYVGGNPVNSVDPLGLCDEEECDEIGKKIDDHLNRNKHDFDGKGTHGLKYRYAEQITGKFGPHSASWARHHKQIIDQKKSLKRLLDKWNDNNCSGGLPASVYSWLSVPPPSPSEWRGPDDYLNNIDIPKPEPWWFIIFAVAGTVVFG